MSVSMLSEGQLLFVDLLENSGLRVEGASKMTQRKSRAPEEQPWRSYSSLHG